MGESSHNLARLPPGLLPKPTTASALLRSRTPFQKPSVNPRVLAALAQKGSASDPCPTREPSLHPDISLTEVYHPPSMTRSEGAMPRTEALRVGNVVRMADDDVLDVPVKPAASHESVIQVVAQQSLDVKAWDVFRLLPPRPDRNRSGLLFDLSLQALKLLTYPIIFCLLILSALVSKAGILLMTSAIGLGGKELPLCGRMGNLGIFTQNATITVQHQHVAKYVWALYFSICAPEIFCFIRCLQRVCFRNVKKPTAGQFFQVLITETLYALGVGLLVFKVLPDLDAIAGAMLTNCLCFLPAVLTLLSRKPCKLTVLLVIIDLVCIAAQSSGFWAWPIFQPGLLRDAWAVPLALLLCSVAWWENYVHRSSVFPCVRMLANRAEQLQQVRSKTYVWVAPWKCIIYLCTLFTFMAMRVNVQQLVQPDTFGSKNITGMLYKPIIIEPTYETEMQEPEFVDTSYMSNRLKPVLKAARTTPTPQIVDISDYANHSDRNFVRGGTEHFRMKRLAEEDWVAKTFYTTPYDALWLFLVIMLAAFFCYQCAKFACKVKIQQLAFALPLNLTGPALVFILTSLGIQRNQDPCYFTNVLPYELFWRTPTFVNVKDLILTPQTWFWVLWLLSQVWITVHTWLPKCERLADTDRLFVLPWYSATFLDQSLTMNRRRDDTLKIKAEDIEAESEDNASGVYETISNVLALPPGSGPGSVASDGQKSSSTWSNSRSSDTITRIKACATMWHETREEMLCMLKSIFRLDEDQSARRNAMKFMKIIDPEYFEFEAHIMFDDAFEMNEYGEPQMNRFVKQLLEVIDVAAGAVHQITMRVKPPKKFSTPYGGQLVWTLPGKNSLTVHLKDKNKIRVRKRWSQVMYMYYLLGHKLMEKHEDLKRKETIAENTYILTLDGDVDFQPSSVHLLVDLMKKNRRLGAACGRIHPRGAGPMVWYQQFEYAIGHWFQKATEHMIGCVLCSPGCFSLFRSAALMDDNVLRRYATKAEKAKDYIQYDQGEDRWLCTLLLQRGYRVEYCAASDALTFAPQSFNEFFNQRRRWIPSTVANIIDLLADHKSVVKLNDSISVWYIIYQMAMLLSSILGPGTIFLMVAGAVNISFFPSNIHASFILVLLPVLIFMVVCFTCKPDWQVFYAMVISAIFGLLMAAVIVGTALQIKKDGISSPHAIFLLWVIGSFFLAACLHPMEFKCIIPGILYFLAIPATYLLLIIYSVCNLHVVSWGTREVKEDDQRHQKRKGKQLGILNEDGQDPGELDGVYSVGCGSTCRLLCCLQPSAIGNSPQVAKIAEKLDQIDRKIERFDRRSHVRRGSTIAAVENFSAEPLMEEEDEPVEDNFDLPYHEMQREKAAQSEEWLNDKCMRHAERAYLDNEEEKFWRDLVDKFLYPLKLEMNQTQINADLRALRNQVSFGFFMANALFILIVFLLQLKKDCLNVEWPLGAKMNRSVIPCNSKQDEEIWVISGLQLEPIGFVFLFFFMSLLIIQFVAMLLHRFGTLSHILASTNLFCFRKSIDKLSGDELVAEHFVEIAKELQAIKGVDDDSNVSMADPEQTISRRRVVKSLENSRKSASVKRTETLDAAFKKRWKALNSEKPGLVDEPSPFHRHQRLTLRRGTVKALEDRRNSLCKGTMDRGTPNPYVKQQSTGKDISSQEEGGASRGPARRKVDRLFHHQNGDPRRADDAVSSSEEDVHAPVNPRPSSHTGSTNLVHQDSWAEQEGSSGGIKRSGFLQANTVGLPSRLARLNAWQGPHAVPHAATPPEQRSGLLRAEVRQGSSSSEDQNDDGKERF